MNLFQLSWNNLKIKPLNTLLSLILFALGISLISLMFILNKQVSDKINRNKAGIDLVVGAKGSPLQMILSSIYQIDAPTGNIPLALGTRFLKHPLIGQAIPLALGDSYKGFRIVGTDHQYPEFYKVELAKGELWQYDMEATIGASVAKKLGLKINDTFYGAHGMVDDGIHVHDDAAYHIVGILKESGTVLDQLILTSVSSVWRAHESHDDDEHDEEHDHDAHDEHDHGSTHDDNHTNDEHKGHDHDEHSGHDHAGHDHDEAIKHTNLPPLDTAGKEITSYLIAFAKDKNGIPAPMANIALPNFIDDKLTGMGYAFPVREIYRLLSITGVGISLIKGLALVFILISGFSVFISLYNSLKERRYELAQMRVLGASKASLLLLVLMEGLIIAILGYILGIGMSHLGMAILSGMLQESYNYPFKAWEFLTEEFWLFGGAVLVGLLASIIPALQAYSTNISETLKQ